MKLPRVLSGAFFATLAITAPVDDHNDTPLPSATTKTLEERDGTITEAFVSFASAEFSQIFGTPPYCCNGAPPNCWAAASPKDAPGDPWQLCYTPGDNVFSQGDADVINCLTNLHYQQSGDMCISVAGSSCDNGYVSGGGRVQNLWISSNNLDAAQSSAIQGAYGQLVGQKIRNDNPGGTQIPYVPEVSVLSPTNGAQEILAAVRYIGEDAC